MKDTPFTADRLLALYDRVGEAEDAIPRLRRFVLDLAVRGKLVEQDPSDEPAAELLKRIAKEKARLVKAGGLRSSKVADPAMVDAPFDLPFNWAWAAIGTVFIYDAGDKRDPKELDRGLWLLELEDLEKDTGRLLERMTVDQRASQSTKSQFRAGDILYGKLRPYLNKVLVADEPGYSTTEIVALRPYLPLCSSYCALALRRPDFVEYVTRLGQGTKMPRLRTEDAVVAPFPLPPLAEQQRIVAKVDDLMALCDQLEQARAGREAVRYRLTAATWARLTAPETGAETFPTHARAALQTLPTLTTRPDQIKTLRQTILNLAVRGKLVEQDPTDEPVAQLLAQDIPLPTGYTRRRKILKASSVDASIGLLGTVPLTWSYLTIQDLFDQNVVVDYADGNHGSLYPRSSEFGGDGVNFVSAKDLSNGRVNWQTCSKLNEARASQLSKGWAKTGDVLLTHNATVGRVARVVEEVEPFLLGTSVTFYRLNPLALDSNYFFYVLQSPVWQGQLEAIMAQTTRNQVSIQKQASFFVPLPPLAEQHRIAAKVDALMALCDQLEASLTTATTTRSRLLEALLHEALGGTLSDQSEVAA